MRKLILAIMLACSLGATAQDWGLRWIACPAAGEGGQVWFRRTFTVVERPPSARLTIASAGTFELFVNGYNVTTDVLTPLAGSPSDTIRVMTFEVGRFLRADSNVVAVWYSPSTASRKQLALSIYGGCRDSDRVAIETDGQWFCRPANARVTPDGGETIDDGGYITDWNTAGASVTGWLPACEPQGLRPSPIVLVPPIHKARRIRQISRYTFLDDLGSSIVYRFGARFDGWVRLTLRGMHRGDTLSVNGLTYICSGRTDEQACRRFTTSASTIAVVSGPEGFSRENVTDVEAIDIETYTHTSYLY